MAHGIFLFDFKSEIKNLITSCPDGDPLDEMRSIIDRNIVSLEGRIRSLEYRIRTLKSRRNELSPISRLPTELLCNIFSVSILWIPNSPKPNLNWANFSQVSQHWRSLALGAPELWTNIPLSYPRWAQEMLIRSKMAKLIIRSGNSWKPKTIETIISCLYEMNRVGEIDISFAPGSVLEEIFRDLPKSAPQLRTLRIGSRLSTGTAFSIHEDFLHDTERLQHVELFNCKISWDSRLLTGLTRLTLEDSLKANSSINQFLHALQRMPALTELRLENSIPDDSEDTSTYPVVDLPCLRVLNISSGVGALTTVLRHITFPHNTMWSLTCSEEQSTLIDFSNFLSVLATKFLSSLVRSIGLRGLKSTQIDYGLESYFGLDFYLLTSATSWDCLPLPFSENSQSQLELFLLWPSSPQHRLLEVLTCFFGAMDLPLLTQLQISDLDCIDSNTWIKTFGKLPLLEWVCVDGKAIQWFLEALVYKTKAAEKSKTAYRNVTFPKLRYISLVGGIFEFPEALVDMLLDCLMERYERNAEVQVLHLEDCQSSFWPNDVRLKRLEEIVVDFIWTGY
jgi:F-box-like